MLSGDVVTCNRVLQGVVDVLLGAGIPVSATPELVCVSGPAPATLAPAGGWHASTRTLRGASRVLVVVVRWYSQERMLSCAPLSHSQSAMYPGQDSIDPGLGYLVPLVDTGHIIGLQAVQVGGDYRHPRMHWQLSRLNARWTLVYHSDSNVQPVAGGADGGVRRGTGAHPCCANLCRRRWQPVHLEGTLCTDCPWVRSIY
jgi:hypothetical protein